MSEREQFEAWYKKYDRDTQRQYWTRESACWHAWQAARAQPAPITSESGKPGSQGASAITSGEVPLLTDDELQAIEDNHLEGGSLWDVYRAIESLVRSKLGAGVPMRERELECVIADLTAESKQLRGLLTKLIDIEGPQPGTAEWADEVRETLGIVGKEGA